MLDAMTKIENYLAENGVVSETDSRLLRDIAYDRIQAAIKHAGVEPGEPLSETRLSKALGISRTPIREALQRLAQEGLLQIIPGRAITVAAPSMQDVLDVVHVRELLEPEVVRLAAESLSAQDRETLQTLTTEMEQAAKTGQRALWSQVDIKWHEVLCNLCPNRLLGQMVLEARNRMYNKGSDDHVTDQYLIEGTLEHKRVVEAILAQDGPLAEQSMREHIRSMRENMFKRLIRY
jgi:DNA-binding GntR family transcriptional regulator